MTQYMLKKLLKILLDITKNSLELSTHYRNKVLSVYMFLMVYCMYVYIVCTMYMTLTNEIYAYDLL